MAFALPSIPSLRSIMSSIGIGGLLGQISILQSPPESTCSQAMNPFEHGPRCEKGGPLSCHGNSTEASCCFINPGGQLLQTQFWDSSPPVGPKDSWTLHGLWPDLCDGTYDQFCTNAPQYTNITQILEAAGQFELLDYMNIYWQPNSGTAESFWEHEWNKHGTCINTLAPSCYGDDYLPGMEVVDFFTRTVLLFQTLDTYQALAEADIWPSFTKTYSAAQIQEALTRVTGQSVVLGCYNGSLSQAWYTYNVRGSLQTGEFVAVEPAGSGGGSCPPEGIRYLPKKGT